MSEPGPEARPDDAEVGADPTVADWGFSPRRIRAWHAANRAKADILLIGAVALGGIVCMMVVTVVVLVTQLHR